MNLWNETKSIPISRFMIWAVYKNVKSNKGSAEIDELGWTEFESSRSKYLYKLWNRMSSGSYFPTPLKEVEIPKKDGSMRKLGIPTIIDRIGQQVIKHYLESRFESLFTAKANDKLNPVIRGWVNYYGKYRLWEHHKVFRMLHSRLVHWARRKYKRYKTSIRRGYEWLKQMKKQFPYLFYHWKLSFSI